MWYIIFFPFSLGIYKIHLRQESKEYAIIVVVYENAIARTFERVPFDGIVN